MSRDPIGVTGLGQEGLPVALRLLAAGHAVFGYERRRPDQAFLGAGGQACRAPAELADHCPTVLTLLPSAQALMEVTDSSDGLRATTRRDGIWLEMSTISEQAKRTAAGRLANGGWHVLDCSISGTPVELDNASAVIFSSGSRDVYDQAAPVLQAVSPRVRYVGEFGAAIRAKYVAQLLLAGHSLVAAEALAFARAAGLPPAEMLTSLSGSITSSAIFEQRGPQILAEPSADHARGRARPLAAGLSDARQIAIQAGMRTPVLDQALAYIEALAEGSADEPVVALYQELAPSHSADSQSRATTGNT